MRHPPTNHLKGGDLANALYASGATASSIENASLRGTSWIRKQEGIRTKPVSYARRDQLKKQAQNGLGRTTKVMEEYPLS